MPANPPLDLTVESNDGTVTISLQGEVDPHTAPLLEGEVRAALLSPTVTTLVLDLSGVQFMDSSGLRVVISTQRSMRERDGRLVLRHPTATVRHLLEITQLSGEIDIEEA